MVNCVEIAYHSDSTRNRTYQQILHISLAYGELRFCPDETACCYEKCEEITEKAFLKSRDIPPKGG